MKRAYKNVHVRPALAWLQSAIAGRPYALRSNSLRSIPGLPRPVAPKDAKVLVVYDNTPITKQPSSRGAPHVNALLYSYGNLPESNRHGKLVIMAVEVLNASAAKTFRDMASPYFQVFIGTTPRTTSNVTNNLEALSLDEQNKNRAEKARKLIWEYHHVPGPKNKTEKFRARKSYTKIRGTNTPFYKEPSKKTLTGHASDWASGMYERLQTFMRTNKNAYRTNHWVVQTARGLELFMQRFALRAPHMPPKVRNMQTGSSVLNLYRGVRLTNEDVNSLLQKGEIRDKGFVAFSRNKQVAMAFADEARCCGNKIVFKLNVQDVPRGTPWIWYAGPAETYRPSRRVVDKNNFTGIKEYFGAYKTKKYHTNWVRGIPLNSEVLLPPGTLRLLKAPNLAKNNEVLVSYHPSHSCDAGAGPCIHKGVQAERNLQRHNSLLQNKRA